MKKIILIFDITLGPRWQCFLYSSMNLDDWNMKSGNKSILASSQTIKIINNFIYLPNIEKCIVVYNYKLVNY